MSKFTFFFFPFLFLNSISFFAQNSFGITTDTNWFTNWTSFKPTTIDYNEATIILTGVIDKNKVLTKNNTYLLVGSVYVINNATLSIEHGTVIRGDKVSCGTLVITKGSKILANGIETDPIIFTSNSEINSRKPGDWGGIIILGDAPINKLGGINYLDFDLDSNFSRYGGQNPTSNSGILKYVRIEYAGKKLNAQKELNGLSMAGVGKETQIDFVQISFSNDDSFESYGGNIQLNHLVSYRATDDDFDFTQGVSCSIANSVAIRNPFSSDASGSRCFEVDSFDKNDNSYIGNHLTNIVAYNITLINTQDNSQGLVREAIYIKKNSLFTIHNSIIFGFKSCLLLDEKIKIVPEELSFIKIQNCISNNCNLVVASEAIATSNELDLMYSEEKFNSKITHFSLQDFFIQPDLKRTVDLRIKASVN